MTMIIVTARANASPSKSVAKGYVRQSAAANSGPASPPLFAGKAAVHGRADRVPASEHQHHSQTAIASLLLSAIAEVWSAGLVAPRLQSAVFGSAVMGYGDLFVAGALGGLLALAAGRALQLRGAALTAIFALAFDLLFFALDELPATVPVAAALIAILLTRRWRAARSRPAPPGSPGAAARPRAARAPAAR